MRGLIQKLCICGLLVLATTMPAQSTCVFGLGNTCEPSEADGRKVFEQLMASYLQPPYTIVSFQKTNGIKGQMRGFDVYEMQFAGVLQGDDINCKPGTCIELQRYSVAHNKDNHTFTIRGSLLFRNSERGWSTN